MNDKPLSASLDADVLPDEDHLVTEDETPVDDFFSGVEQRLLVNVLDCSWSEKDKEQSFVAAANVGLYFAAEEPPLVPDFLLSLRVKIPTNWWAKKNRCYFTWRFGKVPDLVAEIVSNREGNEDGDKMKKYAQFGVPYYVIHDPQKLLCTEELRVFTLIHKTYEPTPPEWLPAVGLGLTLWPGTVEDCDATWLRWTDHNGAILLSGRERAELADQRIQQEKRRTEQAEARAEQEKQRTEQAEARAEQEKQRTEQAEARAEQEKQRAERLAAQLRALGIDPNA